MSLDGFIIVIGIIWFTLANAIALMAYKEDRNPVVWWILSLIFGIFAILLYFATTPSKKSKELEQRVESIEE